ncbi:hypothetical protein MRS44_011272 [Fusarium solani]|uniref:uncharacterized protein n=1 Tax=Fusarium solani TaxID=169388 RepID=UPI0032C417CB|nr:hypothetical protein MRS44_011272 [Fusarium solani]
MRTLSLVLFSLSGVLALEKSSDNGGVGAAQMPDCAINCIKEHVPNSGCDLLHTTCLCDPDFRTKHGPAIAPCFIVLCDANEINKVQSAWRGGDVDCNLGRFCLVCNCDNRAEFKDGSAQHLGSSPGRKGFNTNDDDIDAKAGAKIDTTGIDTKTNPNTNNLEFNLERNFNFNFKLNSKTNAYTNTEINDEFNVRKRNRVHKLDDYQHVYGDTKIDTNPNPGQNPSAKQQSAPPVTPTQEIQDVGKGVLSATTPQPLQASEIDGREAPRE